MEKKLSLRRLIVASSILTSLILAACAATPKSSPTAVSTGQQTPISPTAILSPATSTTLPTASSTPEILDEPVSVTVTADALVIANNSPVDIYYAAFPQEELALIEWAPCQHPDDCPEDRIEPGQSISLSLQVVTLADTTVITVFWWHLVENSDGSGYYHTDLTFIDVELR